MDSIYIEYKFIVEPKEPASDILIAELGNVGFESFVENEEGVIAYIQKNEWKGSILEDIFILNSDVFSIKYKYSEIEQINWNAEWEKNFNSIQVDNTVSIRAPFHKNPNLPYDIIIEPKMSFGTGHHETTYMMVQHLLNLDVKKKKVLDIGCGTGILAIFAEKKGAKFIDAIDIDEWCYKNTVENVERNNCSYISAQKGDSSILLGRKYDIIIANINRNILLNDVQVYAGCLNNGGLLLLSGFYKEDIPIINKEVSKYGLSLQNTIERNNWVALRYKK